MEKNNFQNIIDTINIETEIKISKNDIFGDNFYNISGESTTVLCKGTSLKTLLEDVKHHKTRDKKLNQDIKFIVDILEKYLNDEQ